MIPFFIEKLFERIPLYILLLAVLLSLHLLKLLCKNVPHAHRARQRGCLPAPLELSKLPFGIDTLLASLRADRDQLTPDHVANRFAALGVYTFRMSILGTTNLVTAESRNVQVILATQFNDFSMRATRSTNLKTVLGRSIFAADEHVQTLFRCIEKEKSPTIADGTWSMPVSLAALLPSLTLDSATELFLGQSTSTLQASLDGDDYHPGMEFHHAYAASTGSTARASYMAKKEGSSQALYNFLGVLRERCSGGDEEAMEQVLGLLAGGRDTTASLMSWTWYCLLHNPLVFAKLRSEILSTFDCSPMALRLR
ncbi:Cytochrome P450 [Fusarium oxysporum f. sp. vasinfectum]|nr:Cytochrome P450 [Fusarium oxysporum f. sp. vasinfectum]